MAESPEPQATPGVVSTTAMDFPQLAPGLELVELEEEGALPRVGLPGGQVFEVAPYVARLLRLIDGRRGLSDLAECLSNDLGQSVAPAEVGRWLEQSLVPLGLVHFGSPLATDSLERQAEGLKLPFIGASTTAAVARALSFAFHPLFFSLAIPSLVVSRLMSYHIEILPQDGAAWFELPTFSLMLGLAVASMILHEFGHAAAMSACGERPGGIGWRLHMGRPVFYTDVRRAWRLPSLQRALVDIGGVYFQVLFSSMLLLAHVLTEIPGLLAAAVLIDFTTLFALLPTFQSDGFWLLRDLSGTRAHQHQGRGWLAALLSTRTEANSRARKWVLPYLFWVYFLLTLFLTWIGLDFVPRLWNELHPT